MTFFKYETDLPEGSGFALFSGTHLIGLVFVLIVGIILYRIYASLTDVKRIQMERLLAISIVMLDCINDGILIAIGHFELCYLPLHLCGMAQFIILIHAITRREYWGDILYALFLPGALGALLFPDWSAYPIISFMSFHDFINHGLLILYPMLLIKGRHIHPSINSIWKPVVFLAVTVPIIYYINSIFDTNFFFLKIPAPDSPLSFILSITGKSFYLFGFACLMLLVMCVMYVPFIIRNYYKK